MGTVLTYQPHRLHIFDRFFNKFSIQKTPCLLHLQVPHQLEPELEAALQNLWLLELDQEALSDKEKRLQQAPQLPDPALQEQTVEECGNSTLVIHQELKLAQFLFWLSLLFIASVFLLHIWGKYTRS